MDEKVKEAGERLKIRLRAGEIGTASCKILSKGDDCNCSLCLVDFLLSKIVEKEKKVEELEKSYEIEKSISLAITENKGGN